MKHTLLSLSIGAILISPVFAQTTSLQEAAGSPSPPRKAR